MLPQAIAKVQAISVGQEHVDDDRVGPFDRGDREAGLGARRRRDVELFLQHQGIEIELSEVVFDQQHRWPGSPAVDLRGFERGPSHRSIHRPNGRAPIGIAGTGINGA